MKITATMSPTTRTSTTSRNPFRIRTISMRVGCTGFSLHHRRHLLGPTVQAASAVTISATILHSAIDTKPRVRRLLQALKATLTISLSDLRPEINTKLLDRRVPPALEVMATMPMSDLHSVMNTKHLIHRVPLASEATAMMLMTGFRPEMNTSLHLQTTSVMGLTLSIRRIGIHTALGRTIVVVAEGEVVVGVKTSSSRLR